MRSAESSEGTPDAGDPASGGTGSSGGKSGDDSSQSEEGGAGSGAGNSGQIGGSAGSGAPQAGSGGASVTGGNASGGGATTGGNAGSGGGASATGGNASGGGATTGGSAGTGGPATGGDAGVGGLAGSGGGSGSGGLAGAAGSGGYEPCAGKACGEECAPCDPDDPECVSITVLMTCDAGGACVLGESSACPELLWSETDAAQYGIDDSGTTTLHNDTDATVYLPGCEAYYYERQVGGVWTFIGPQNVLCTWEGAARPVLPEATYVSDLDPFDDLDVGTWRIRHDVGYGCTEDQPMRAEYCTSLGEVFSPPYTVGIGPECGDPALMASYAECSAASDADTCASLGGTWGLFSLSEIDICQCSTGDGDCACTQDSECVTMCLARTGAGGIDDCSEVSAGTCAAGPTMGCWCRLAAGGDVSTICID